MSIDTIIIALTIQMRKLRLREVKPLAKSLRGVESKLEARTSFCHFSGEMFLVD